MLIGWDVRFTQYHNVAITELLAYVLLDWYLVEELLANSNFIYLQVCTYAID